MHLLATASVGLEEVAQAVDLDQSPGDAVVLSFADTDLAALAAAARQRPGRPHLRLASLKSLAHPMSVDLYVEKVIDRARFVIVRALGGLDYWRYGLEQVAASCRARRVPFVALPGDDRDDPRLGNLSTASPDIVQRIAAYLTAGGSANLIALLDLIAGELNPAARNPLPAPAALPTTGCYLPTVGAVTLDQALAATSADRPIALLTFYRATLAAADLAAIDALIAALAARGLAPLAIFLPSLKDPAARELLGAAIAARRPAVVLNLTAFAARDQAGFAALDQADCAVLQVVQAGMSSTQWRDHPRGLSQSDLVMNVVLPEADGRLLAGAVAFKETLPHDPALDFAPIAFQPVLDRVGFVADRAAAWARLATTTPDRRRLALILSDYPDRGGRQGYAVGLDTAESAAAIQRALAASGYDVGPAIAGPDLLRATIEGPANNTLTLADYQAELDKWPAAARAAVLDAWGAPTPPDGVFRFRIVQLGNLSVALQPGRGGERKSSYHDLTAPPGHDYIAFHIWLRQSGIDALIHLGTHGTLEWLPGKAMALSDACLPNLLLGSLPVIYPFIVNDPGEAAPAKRRLGAVTIGHLTPPLMTAGLHGAAAEIETLFDEYAQADGVDTRRAAALRQAIVTRARDSGLAADCGIAPDSDADSALAKLDSWLCDLKEMAVGDGLHVFGAPPAITARARLLAGLAEGGSETALRAAMLDDLGLAPKTLDDAAETPVAWPARLAPEPRPTIGQLRAALDRQAQEWLIADTEPTDWPATQAALHAIRDRLAPRLDASPTAELAALIAALDGRFIPPGPAGAPSRGRADTLPTGRNLTTLDPRAVPTRTATLLGTRAAAAVIERYLQDEGDWPRQVVMDLWASATMRTGGDDLAQALALMGVRARWDHGSDRVTGFDILTLAELNRPRVDVTLRISGAFRDAFPAQIALFDAAVNAVAGRDEDDADNPLAAARRQGDTLARIFGAAPDQYGIGLADIAFATDQVDRLGTAYLDASGWRYGAEGDVQPAADEFRARIAAADAFLHGQDDAQRDLLDGDDTAEHVGGFAAAARLLAADPAFYQVDTTRQGQATIRTLAQDVARTVAGRLVNPRWIAGQMRHGHRGGAELAQSVDALFVFAATSKAVASRHFDAVYQAYLHDPEVATFLETHNPAAAVAIAQRLDQAWRRGYWQPTHNSAADRLSAWLEPTS